MKSVTKIEETNNIKNNKSKIESKNVQIKSSEIDNKENTRNRNAKTKSNTSTQNKSSKKTSTQNTKDKINSSTTVQKNVTNSLLSNKTNEVIVSNEESQIKKDTNSASSVKTITGLSSREVQDRIDKGLINYNEEPKTKTVKDIVKSNVFTYFNFLNILLGSLVIISGIISGRILYSLKNCLFVNVIFINTLISIGEEILAKKTIDKLSIIAESKIKVVRDNNIIELTKEDLVLDDVCLYTIGNQIVCDSIVLDGEIEINESFITGEEKVITKKKGDELTSGSFVVCGSCFAKIEHVGSDNYVSKITKESKYIKETNSIIYNSFNKMLKVLSALLIPIGILLFINQMNITYSFSDSIMKEEIFGPVLPIIEYENIDEVLEILKEKEKPLALYIFTKNKKSANKILNTISSGGVSLNDTIMHLSNPNLPFGGVGNSGMGQYHGSYSFDTFSHSRSVLVKGKHELNIKYPPYNEHKKSFLKKFTNIK